jgi:polysaccharide biosynthesis protein PslG
MFTGHRANHVGARLASPWFLTLRRQSKLHQGEASLAPTFLALCLLTVLIPTTALAGERWLGVHHGFDNPTVPLERQLDPAQSIGAEVVRVGVSWANLQPTEAEIGDGADPKNFIRRTDANAWHMDELDRTVATAREHGLKIVMLVAEAPCWANSRGPDCDPNNADHHWYPPRPEHTLDFARAMGWLVHRYRDAPVVAWEVWNEPNTTTFWKSARLRPDTFVLAEPPEAEGYVRLLNEAYALLKGIDPKLVVLGGSLAGADRAYLEVMYQHGARYDALALHPYSKARPGTGRSEWPETCRSEEDPLQPPWCFIAVEDIRKLMVAEGDAAKEMWFTEFGAASLDPQGNDDTGGEAGQGEYLARALKLLEGWCYVKAALVYRLYDQPNTGDYTGLFRDDGTAKPAADAFRTVAKAKRWRTCTR